MRSISDDVSETNQVIKDLESWFAKTARALCPWSGQGVDWQDIAQVGAIAAWKAYQNFDPARGDREMWLKGKARWAMLSDVQRAQTNHHKLKEQPSEFDGLGDISALAVWDEEPEEHLTAVQAAEVRHAVATALTKKQREFVVRKYWHQQTPDEIKAAFGYHPVCWYNTPAGGGGAQQRLRERLAHLASFAR